MVVKSWAVITLDGVVFDQSQIVSINFYDKAGTKSDQISVEVLPNVPRPKAGTVVTLELFNDLDEYMDCGTFHLQSVTRRNNKNLSFTATGVEFNQSQKLKRSQNYQMTTLSGIVNLVSGRLGHKVKFETEDQEVESIYQTDESDVQFLDRLAQQHNVLFSIKDGVVFFVNKNIEALPLYTIDASKCSHITVKFSTKTQFKSCEVSFYDRKIAERVKVGIDKGEPVLKVNCVCKNEEEAKLKGKAKLDVAKRGTVSGDLEYFGQKIYAGTRLKLINTFENEDDDIYSIESATHRYTRGGGWTVSVQFENFKI